MLQVLEVLVVVLERFRCYVAAGYRQVQHVCICISRQICTCTSSTGSIRLTGDFGHYYCFVDFLGTGDFGHYFGLVDFVLH